MDRRNPFFRRPPPPIRVVEEEAGRKPPLARAHKIFLVSAGVLLVLAVVAFPRVLAFVELGARELRYFWWLVLLVAFGLWLAFFFGKKRK